MKCAVSVCVLCAILTNVCFVQLFSAHHHYPSRSSIKLPLLLLFLLLLVPPQVVPPLLLPQNALQLVLLLWTQSVAAYRRFPAWVPLLLRPLLLLLLL